MIEIKISGAFYARLQQLAMFNMQDKTMADVEKAVNLLKENKFEDPWSYNYATILILLSTIESEATNQGKVIDKPIEELTKEVEEESNS